MLSPRGRSSYSGITLLPVSEEYLDILTVPKDDTAEFGYAALDQMAIMQKAEEEQLMNRVYCYPGADEVGSVIFARVFCRIKQYQPVFYVKTFSRTSSTEVRLTNRSVFRRSRKSCMISFGIFFCRLSSASASFSEIPARFFLSHSQV